MRVPAAARSAAEGGRVEPEVQRTAAEEEQRGGVVKLSVEGAGCE